jgi:hypothetical protein
VRKLDRRSLCGLAVVDLEEAAESPTTLHRACSDHSPLGRDELVIETLVPPFFVVMVDKFSYGCAEVPFAEKYHPVQALGLDRLDEPFGKRVQVGTPRREDQRRHATVPQQAPKGRGVQRIAIEDDVLNY